ncbi:unnamed protein product [Adineta ricciae]|uniref:Protein quiver n=1 Tax=Adineta ricciae TaxID=249248 RepID=A0A814B2B5_ADIRI|nr:unnamed protein product [Adineta ricciae]CAF0923325.1 unnamed protein product [Adineta ricciae]
MHLDISEYFLLLLVCLVRLSFQLECLQCTSPIRRVSRDWDHSCLDGTLTPVNCSQPLNKTEPPFMQCVSAVHRLGNRQGSGLLIYRGCVKISESFQECDPPIPIDIDKTISFYCSLTCYGDGCNRHSVKNVISSMSTLFDNPQHLLNIVCIVILRSFAGKNY